MRSTFRDMREELGPDTVRGILVVLLSLAVVGVSYGAIAHTAGFPMWLTVAMAALVLAGSSEILFVGLVATGASPIVAALAAVLVNSRNMAYGIHASTFLARTPWRLVGAHIANDESAALALAQEGISARRAAYWLTGLGVFLTWPTSAFLGTLLGQVIPDPGVLGLDAALPALFFGLVVKKLLKDRATLWSAVLGGVIAFVATPFVPAGVAPVLALAGMAVGWVMDRRRGGAMGPGADVPPVSGEE